MDCGSKRSDAARGRRPLARALRLPASDFRLRRSAFTLVELLVVVSIIAILAGLVLGVAGVAAETGREAKTKQIITRLHTLVMEHYDTFRDVRVDLNQTQLEQVSLAEQQFLNNSNSPNPGVVRATLQLAAARERMKMEMPDRWSDFLIYDLNLGLPAPNGDVLGEPAYLGSVPPLAQVYRAQYLRIWTAYNNLPAGQKPSEQDFRDSLVANEGAECLYMIVAYATGDGESRGLFKESDFGDTDGDGAQEILDGWGNPVQFLRWAPGYESPLQLSHARLVQLFEDSENGAAAVTQALDADHDPLDLFRVDQFTADQIDGVQPNRYVVDANGNPARGFRLMPLIYSGGRDEDNDIYTGRLLPELVARAQNGSARASAVDPYVSFNSLPPIGAPNNDDDGDNFTDNINNHLIQAE